MKNFVKGAVLAGAGMAVAGSAMADTTSSTSQIQTAISSLVSSDLYTGPVSYFIFLGIACIAITPAIWFLRAAKAR